MGGVKRVAVGPHRCQGFSPPVGMLPRGALTAHGRAACLQLKTNGAVPMLEYACSERVVPVNTTYLSARR